MTETETDRLIKRDTLKEHIFKRKEKEREEEKCSLAYEERDKKLKLG